MLSYDSPVTTNGQSAATPAPKDGVPTSSQTVQAAPAGVSHNAHKQTHHIWLVTGPAGSGKSTVAKQLASRLSLPYIEGDEFHPPANIEKMSAGIPLTDADRWDWLTALREESIRQVAAGNEGVILTCSALKRKYRDVIRVAPYFNNGVHLHFIYLQANEEMLLKRVAARQNHYMGASMVQSQFDILEPPKPDEIDVISVDVGRSPEEVIEDTFAKVAEVIRVQEERDNNSR